MVAAVFARHLALFGAANGADDGRAQRLAPLGQDRAHPAGSRVHEYGFARAQVVGAAAQVPGGHALQHRGRGGLRVDPVGDRDQLVRPHHPALAVAAEAEAVRDPVAWLE